MLRSVIDAIPSRVYWKDRDSVYLGCNSQFAQATGFPDTSAVVGKTDLDPDWYVGPQDRLNDEMDRRVMATSHAEGGVRQSFFGRMARIAGSTPAKFRFLTMTAM